MAGELGGPSGGDGSRCALRPRFAFLPWALALAALALALAVEGAFSLLACGRGAGALGFLVGFVALLGVGVAVGAGFSPLSAAAAEPGEASPPAHESAASAQMKRLGFDEDPSCGPNFKL